jgi:lysophospholipase L1-like esterase
MLIAAATAALAASGVVPAQAAVSPAAAPVRVMPLGDSITRGAGSSTGSSYRADLWRRLVDQAGYAIDYVGSQRTGQLPDRDNEGHSGWTISQIAAEINGWLATYRPDVVLLHIGTNDMKSDARAAAAPGLLSSLIDQIRAATPAATVIVAQIVPSSNVDINARVVKYNATIPGIVAAKGTTKVRSANLYRGMNTATDLADSLHPNDAGFAKMAMTWYAALVPVLSGTNLARGRTATGSTSCRVSESPAKAVDGTDDGNSKWCSTASSRWLRVDLGSSVTVSRFVLHHAAAGGEPAGLNSRGFRVQTSTDGSTWSTRVTVTVNTDGVTTHLVEPRAARYVQLLVDVPTNNGVRGARIYELEAYR